MKPRGTLARLSVLEDQAAQRCAQVEAAKEGQWERASLGLSADDWAALQRWVELEELGGPEWENIERLLKLSSAPLPGGEAAWAWYQRVCECPDGVSYPLPPVGTAEHYRAEQGWAAQVQRCLMLAPDLHTGASWTAAHWAWIAGLAGVLGGGG